MFSTRLLISLALLAGAKTKAAALPNATSASDNATLSNAQTKPDYLDPNTVGGSMLTGWVGLGNRGEPLNVVISARSDPEVLTNEGFKLYLNSLNISQPCLNMVGGLNDAALMNAFLDENGNQTELFTWRENFGNSLYGTCLQTFKGGWHTRVFNQTSTGAIFLAASTEEDLSHHHQIKPNGYDEGRDWISRVATSNPNGTWISTPVDNKAYRTVAKNVTGLLAAGSEGINHDIATDGITTILTISMVKTSSAILSIAPDPKMVLIALVVMLLSLMGQ